MKAYRKKLIGLALAAVFSFSPVSVFASSVNITSGLQIGGDDVRLFHVGFLSFSAVQAALLCASDYEMRGDRVLLRGAKNFFFFSPGPARATAVRLDLT